MRIFISGASGFIGTHLLRHLLAHGWEGKPAEICCVIRKASALPKESLNKIIVIESDLCQGDAYRVEANQADIVFHVAADARVRSGQSGYKNNLDSTRTLLSILKSSTQLKRLVLVSSIGAVDRTPEDGCESPLNEESLPHPVTAYGKSKLESEVLVKQSGLPYCIVRPTWVYGPGMRSDSHICKLIELVQRSSPWSRIDWPGQVSVVYISDLVRALLAAGGHPSAMNNTYFVSDAVPISIGNLFRRIRGCLGKNESLIGLPSLLPSSLKRVRSKFPLEVQSLLYDVLTASPAKIEALGFRAEVSFDKGLANTLHAKTKSSDKTATALITGAASGIGRSLALQMYAQGARVVAVDKDNAPNWAELENFRWISIDLTHPEMKVEIQAIWKTEPEINTLINCAGMGVRGRFDDLELDTQMRTIELNVKSLVQLTHLAIREFKDRKIKGQVINVASSASFQPLPYMAVYAASKAFVLSFSEAVSEEARGKGGFHLLTVIPGGTATQFQASAGVKQNAGEKLMSPNFVASRILGAVKKQQSLVVIGANAWKMSFLARFLSRSFSVKLWERLMSSHR